MLFWDFLSFKMQKNVFLRFFELRAQTKVFWSKPHWSGVLKSFSDPLLCNTNRDVSALKLMREILRSLDIGGWRLRRNPTGEMELHVWSVLGSKQFVFRQSFIDKMWGHCITSFFCCIGSRVGRGGLSLFVQFDLAHHHPYTTIHGPICLAGFTMYGSPCCQCGHSPRLQGPRSCTVP